VGARGEERGQTGVHLLAKTVEPRHPETRKCGVRKLWETLKIRRMSVLAAQ
jgi:hypothetical protein